MRVAEAGVWGTTVLGAAQAKAEADATAASTLADVTALAEQCLLAGLPDALPVVMRVLADRAALDTDVGHLAQALPALVRALRYGDVRGTGTGALTGVAAGLAERVFVGLPPACTSLDTDAAQEMRAHVDAVHTAVSLLTETPAGARGGAGPSRGTGAGTGTGAGADAYRGRASVPVARVVPRTAELVPTSPSAWGPVPVRRVRTVSSAPVPGRLPVVPVAVPGGGICGTGGGECCGPCHCATPCPVCCGGARCGCCWTTVGWGPRRRRGSWGWRCRRGHRPPTRPPGSRGSSAAGAGCCWCTTSGCSGWWTAG